MEIEPEHQKGFHSSVFEFSVMDGVDSQNFISAYSDFLSFANFFTWKRHLVYHCLPLKPDPTEP